MQVADKALPFFICDNEMVLALNANNLGPVNRDGAFPVCEPDVQVAFVKLHDFASHSIAIREDDDVPSCL